MRQNKYLKIVCLFMATVLLALSGCSNKQTETESGAVNEAEKDSTQALAEGSTLAADYDIFDRTLVDGKMACYFLCSGNDLTSWEGSATQGGDCILFIMPDGTTAMIDCGHQAEGASIVAKLQRLGIEKLDYFINSHPHGDHIGGFSILARYIEIGHVYMPYDDVMDRSAKTGVDFLKQVEELKIPYTQVSEGDTFTIGDVSVKAYNPPIGFGSDTSINLNESSLVLKFTYGDSSFMMNGDIGNNPDYGYKTEEVLVEKYGDELKADVSKVGHHGSDKTKSSTAWREAVDAKIYVATTPYVRDDEEHYKNVLTGAWALTTALDGDILVTTTGDGTYDVHVAKERMTDYYGLLDTVDGHMKVE